MIARVEEHVVVGVVPHEVAYTQDVHHARPAMGMDRDSVAGVGVRVEDVRGPQ
jgi:hypothetical protein